MSQVQLDLYTYFMEPVSRPATGTLRPFRHRDFSLIWTGAFLSFTGSWIQSVAQGWLVYDLTRDEAKLAFVTFCGMAPLSLFGIFAGTLADTLNRRVVLALSQATFGLGALFLAYVTITGVVQYWHIVTVALILGIVNAIEIPTRQSIVASVVPAEDLAAAVPLNALTFNAARMVGPAIGGILLAQFGAGTCYLVNGISYLALIFAVLAVRADLRAVPREPEPIKDLLLGGMRYTFHDVRLKTLFLMEATVSMFGLFYIALMPAIAREMLHLGKTGLGNAFTAMGVGAVIGLVSVAHLSNKPYKAILARLAMTAIGLGLVGLSFSRTEWTAFPLLALVGGASVMQFNTTNTLFQLLSPPNLRGRVIAMHVWALSGLAPFGTLFFGWLATVTTLANTILAGGGAVLVGAIMAWIHRDRLNGAEVIQTVP